MPFLWEAAWTASSGRDTPVRFSRAGALEQGRRAGLGRRLGRAEKQFRTEAGGLSRPQRKRLERPVSGALSGSPEANRRGARERAGAAPVGDREPRHGRARSAAAKRRQAAPRRARARGLVPSPIFLASALLCCA